MPTPIFVCGAECGIAALGTASGGTEHWSGLNGTPTVETSGPASMRSTRVFRFNPSAAQESLTHTFAAAISSPATLVGRLYFYFASLPTGAAGTTYVITSTNAGNIGVTYDIDTGTIRTFASTVKGASGVSVTTGVWYRLDYKLVRAATWTADAQVDGVACAQASSVQSANTLVDVTFGQAASKTADMYVDDIIISGTSGDYPIGAGTVKGVYPTADGTHGGGWASGVFGKGTSGGTAATNADTDIWQSLDNPLVATAAGTWVSNNTATAVTNYVEFACDNLPADASTINGAMMVATFHSASATANTSWLQGVYSGASSTYWNNVDLSESTITIPCVIDSNATTVTRVNELVVRFSSNDSNPDSYLDGFCLEVDYVAVPLTGPPSLKRGRNTRNQLALSRGGF